MEKRRSFAAAVVTGVPPIPPPPTRPSQWEAYLLQEMKKLQSEICQMKLDLQVKDEIISTLQIQLQNKDKQGQDDLKGDGIQVNTDQTKVTNNLVSEVISTIKEQDQVEANKKVIRVGGLMEDWTQAEIEEDEYMTETDKWKKLLDKAVPFVDLGEPVYIKIQGKQASIHYDTMEEKIKVMKQTKSLQGTKVWISDELTPSQLKNRASELTKVREARKAGQWAVYRGGKAIIRDFKTPLPKPDTSPI